MDKESLNPENVSYNPIFQKIKSNWKSDRNYLLLSKDVLSDFFVFKKRELNFKTSNINLLGFLVDLNKSNFR